MAKAVRKTRARRPTEEELSEEAKVMRGAPQDGDPAPDDDPDNEPDDDADDDQIDDEPQETPEQELTRLRQENARINGELTGLRGRQAEPRQRQQRQEEEPEAEPDWDKEFFESPAKALNKFADGLTKKITTNLEAKYQRANGEQQFWNTFYTRHDDLREDDDLARTTLTKHWEDLADLPVEKATDRLAELTRERILKYTGGRKQKGNEGDDPQPRRRPVVEGAGSPRRPEKKPEPAKVTRLSDVIKARRKTRLSKSVAA